VLFRFLLALLLGSTPSLSQNWAIAPQKGAVTSKLTHCALKLRAQSAVDISLRNSRVVTCDAGDIIWAQRLRNGRGSSEDRLPNGSLNVRTDARLKWAHVLDRDHLIVAHWWVWVAASSSSSEYVQVIERQEDRWVVVQQIEMDIHHGGNAVGADYDAARKTLITRAVHYADGEGRCCPSLMDVVTFRWNGARFIRRQSKRVPLAKGFLKD
jgi:hypothetical protein